MDSDNRPLLLFELTREEKLMLTHYRMMSREDQEQLIEKIKEIDNDSEK